MDTSLTSCLFVAIIFTVHAVASKLCSNLIYFPEVDSLKWSQHAYSVGEGQLFQDSVVVAPTKNQPVPSINVTAGCQGGEIPILDFLDELTVSNMICSIYSPDAQEMDPSSLVFGGPDSMDVVIFGSMTFTIRGRKFKCKGMRIGKGKYRHPHMLDVFSENMWWLGATTCLRRTYMMKEWNSPIDCDCGVSFRPAVSFRGNAFIVTVTDEDDYVTPQPDFQIPESMMQSLKRCNLSDSEKESLMKDYRGEDDCQYPPDLSDVFKVEGVSSIEIFSGGGVAIALLILLCRDFNYNQRNLDDHLICSG
eukprot:gnl/MRDRNA2_/MRDRNA2_72868_c0_seq1.p1 gnl/MRDRNA2_/MRDRNA2_72868_c0~~gnl/MRDRNA2_/MRDRNA2_72868_c0_seq1.p1  ORF type:complete len:323 (-),score=24.06 gnl/MRDRNA2_/MRDRNA2_72868_c0_seq1:264-1181(-)